MHEKVNGDREHRRGVQARSEMVRVMYECENDDGMHRSAVSCVAVVLNKRGAIPLNCSRWQKCQNKSEVSLVLWTYLVIIGF
jgi:hypothetical protein